MTMTPAGRSVRWVRVSALGFLSVGRRLADHVTYDHHAAKAPAHGVTPVAVGESPLVVIRADVESGARRR
ncbi:MULTISPECIES: hypothetical protein [Rhodococcus]|uniref:Uncharacterized protein n=1 Tax=Rhodococcus jostii TaxID=132919 RepID=A0ABU4CIJ9_RHOJO|nr:MULTISPECIES: hypothetical protein [Rhodococcus]MDI9975671.1 hypothetical protein [Rhodococcus sp. IEGM 1307]MDV6283073.1 hypothetical protein [Rhodococcus jostii]